VAGVARSAQALNLPLGLCFDSGTQLRDSYKIQLVFILKSCRVSGDISAKYCIALRIERLHGHFGHCGHYIMCRTSGVHTLDVLDSYGVLPQWVADWWLFGRTLVICRWVRKYSFRWRWLAIGRNCNKTVFCCYGSKFNLADKIFMSLFVQFT
jgi:hypothetical protein